MEATGLVKRFLSAGRGCGCVCAQRHGQPGLENELSFEKKPFLICGVGILCFTVETFS
jgi:hypothetical protein